MFIIIYSAFIIIIIDVYISIDPYDWFCCPGSLSHTHTHTYTHTYSNRYSLLKKFKEHFLIKI